MERQDVIYARQSIDKVDSISIESQIEFCAYETRGKKYKVFYDKGYSGKDTDRPQFREMLKSVRKGEISRVICYKLDRISRSILDFATMMEEFQQNGVEFVSCTEKFDTSTPMGRAMLNICIVFAQLERETIQQRVSDAYISRSRKGFYMGGRIPYGYSLEPYYIDGKKTARYVQDPQESEIVSLIYSMYAQPNTSYGDISRYMKENNIPNTRNKNGCWDRSRIAELIKNPIYVKADINIYNFFKSQNSQIHNSADDYIGTNGIYLYSDKKSDRKSNCLQGQHIVIAPHEGIVSSDIWIRAREKSLKNKQAANPQKSKNTWLVGKIKCGKCGYAMTIRKSSSAGRRYFICSHRMQSHACEGVRGVRADELENTVFENIKNHLDSFCHAQNIKTKDKNQRFIKIHTRLNEIEKEIDGLMKKLANADEVLTKYISLRINTLYSKKQLLLNEIKGVENVENDKTLDKETLEAFVESWEEITIDEKIMVVDSLISVIKVTETNIKIIWKSELFSKGVNE